MLSLPEWFPGAALKRRAAISKDCAMQMIAEPFEYAKKREVRSAYSVPQLELIEDRLQIAISHQWHSIF